MKKTAVSSAEDYKLLEITKKKADEFTQLLLENIEDEDIAQPCINAHTATLNIIEIIQPITPPLIVIKKLSWQVILLAALLLKDDDQAQKAAGQLFDLNTNPQTMAHVLHHGYFEQKKRKI